MKLFYKSFKWLIIQKPLALSSLSFSSFSDPNEEERVAPTTKVEKEESRFRVFS
jgi:hypothetical protein